MLRRLLAGLSLTFVALQVRAADELWLYVADNLQVAERSAALEALIGRASRAGYTHLMLSDSKLSRLGDVPSHYFTNVIRVKAAAQRAGIEIVPAVFPVGYSNDLLWHDPNLAEGPPVKNARFVVRGGIARLESDAPPQLRGGSFDDVKEWDWKDENVVADRGAARIQDPTGSDARIVQKLGLKPWRQYHISVRIKTDHFHGTPEIKVLAGPDGRVLNFDDLGVSATQDWMTHHVVFNSLEHAEASLYLGAWGAETGSLWFDDAAIEEIGLVNLIRRPGAPLTIKTSSDQELREGADFAAVQDPKMGRVQWPGDYDVYHEPPAIRMTRPFPDGTELRVSYQHVASIHAGQVMMDIAEPNALELLRDQARRVEAAFHANAYMMSHDEIRVLGWSEAFRRLGKTPGQLIASNVRACAEILREVSQDARILVWSDMFDPHHNAVSGPYYLVNGSLEGAWEGLAPQVIVVNWNHGKRDQSLKFFADRGHKQLIAAYYDNPLTELGGWFASTRGVSNIIGFMYTTWRGDYGQLEEFARQVKAR